ncbi:hypothetical protein FHX52_3854 [Humibacillus xanthopallidus]|uniref:Secreted protein n=1 Tax=Humibacillus xanthopallidus TaxID=412689 RepID=A0A543PKN5_9MICO|nr:hypothetical protein [Humibacillus xanthopallidus]TQN44638.1 hypothetical protein FHX52_3854 [Humibacillus xanthopallidus]
MRRHILSALLTAVLSAVLAAVTVPSATAASAVSQCPTGGVKVSAADSPDTITDIGGTASAPVVVTITGPSFTITAPRDASYTVWNAHWCLKSSTKTVSDPYPGTGTGGTTLATNSKGKPQDIGYVVVYDVTTTIGATPRPGCFAFDRGSFFGTLYVQVNGENPQAPTYGTYFLFFRDSACTEASGYGLPSVGLVWEIPGTDTLARCQALGGYRAEKSLEPGLFNCQ